MNDASKVTANAVTPSSSRRRLVPVLLLGVAIVVFAVDQLAKNWVVEHLPEGRTVPVLGEFLQWHFVRNPGAAFSMASGSTWIFTILATVVVVVILWQLRRLRSLSWGIFLGLLLGGVLGNLTDRLTREPGFPEGHVIDFILTPWMWLGFNPAIYNIADIAIVSSMLLFVVISLLGLPIDGSPRVRRGTDRDTDAHGQSDDATAADPAADAAEPRSDDTGQREPREGRDDGTA
ncbi:MULTISPECIES: signal peptidase II [unclassified Leucobacter]|uniref:signal peptidase II n=1 Tax=unclassified Leucobacter TaxID=2621730 RepID=UPI00301A0445